jgi:hypothetical protein
LLLISLEATVLDTGDCGEGRRREAGGEDKKEGMKESVQEEGDIVSCLNNRRKAGFGVWGCQTIREEGTNSPISGGNQRRKTKKEIVWVKRQLTRTGGVKLRELPGRRILEKRGLVTRMEVLEQGLKVSYSLIKEVEDGYG